MIDHILCTNISYSLFFLLHVWFTCDELCVCYNRSIPWIRRCSPKKSGVCVRGTVPVQEQTHLHLKLSIKDTDNFLFGTKKG